MTVKAKKKSAVSRLTAEILETARDMRKSGLMTKAAHDKITMRHLDADDVANVTAAALSCSQIRAIREKANLSQAVFARCLNLTPGYVSQLERGEKTPTGPTLVLLNVIRRKGIDAIL
jgi:putative transcriptional regulator